MRSLVTILVALFLASVGVGSAQAMAPSAVVLPTKATLLADGSVRITMKVRCNVEQQAFEWSVDARQGTTFGNDSAGPVAQLIPCDGKFHTVEASVRGANGSYTAGTVNVQALVQLFDAHEGSDVQLEDQAVVRLRP